MDMRKEMMLGDADALFTASTVLKATSDRLSRIANGVADEGVYNRLKRLVMTLDYECRDLAVTGSILEEAKR